jgi:glycerate 2-kinase
LFVPFASDGWDNSEHAGGVCDTITVNAAAKAGLSVEEYLSQHRSFDFFEATGNAIKTGETGANVSDLIIALKS